MHSGLNLTGAIVNAPAVFVVILMSTVLVIGIKESATVNNFIVILKVSIVLVIFFVGLAHFHPANLKPFIAPNTGEWGTYGVSGILRGAGLVFFAYIGFDAVSTAAQEAKNPQRDMPIGILGSLAICTLLYVVVSAVLVGMVPFKDLNVAAPMALAMQRIGAPEFLRVLVDVGAVLGLGSVILVMLLGQSRVFYSMSRDGLLGKWAASVHPRFRTPYLSTIFTGIAVAIATGMLPLQLLGQLVNIGTLLAFVLVSIGVHGVAEDAARAQASLPDAVGAVRAHHGRRLLLRPDAHPAGRHVDPVDRVAPDRLRHLLRVQPAAQPAAEGAGGGRATAAVTPSSAQPERPAPHRGRPLRVRGGINARRSLGADLEADLRPADDLYSRPPSEPRDAAGTARAALARA